MSMQRERGASLPFAYTAGLTAPSIEISNFSSGSCSYPDVDYDPDLEEESFFVQTSPDELPIDCAVSDSDEEKVEPPSDMAAGYPAPMDEFELFCRIANSPARSSPPHSPRNGKYSGHSPMSCSPSDEPVREAQSCTNSPFRIAPTYSRQRSRSVKEKSRNRLLLADDATARSRFSSKSMRERRQSRHPGGQSQVQQLGDDQQLYRVRSFKRTAKGVVSQGDTFRTRSQCSLNSQNSSQVISGSSGDEARCPSATRLSPAGSQGEVNAWQPETTPGVPTVSYRIQVLGAPGVGKSTLCRQFMSSEELAVFHEQEHETDEKFVTVLVDSTESNLTFLDTIRDNDDSDTTNPKLMPDVQAHMVVYAIDNRYSFKYAAKVLKGISEEKRRTSAFFLVANKCDLVRVRSISSEEGKHLATLYHCYFLEVSTALAHKVDDLLVGIVTEIQNQLKRNEKEKIKEERRKSVASKKSFRMKSASKGSALTNFFRKHFAKSCEALHSSSN